MTSLNVIVVRPRDEEHRKQIMARVRMLERDIRDTLAKSEGYGSDYAARLVCDQQGYGNKCREIPFKEQKKPDEKVVGIVGFGYSYDEDPKDRIGWKYTGTLFGAPRGADIRPKEETFVADKNDVVIYGDNHDCSFECNLIWKDLVEMVLREVGAAPIAAMYHANFQAVR